MEDQKEVPADRLNLAYTFFLLHGCGFLLPWNVFMNAKQYYINYKLNTTISKNADYRNNFLIYITMAAQFPYLIMAAWNTFYQRKSRYIHNDLLC
ncbi:unnamed protein product [Hymenolepis diminuta]|uniref:Equilibrative nucleoside transporter 1 n=1 Tax=Hymenolepis diminuta TaxID=6216 RepID=A0A0R3SXL5_HYMDI|nr:unnamed protein product [Hymenolepis diminuta]